MKKLLTLSMAVLLVMSLSILAQETEEMKVQKKGQAEMTDEMRQMSPPAPLSSDWFNWMVGEWEGWTESSMGKSKDWMKIEWSLDKQFVVMNFKSEMVEANQEAMKQWQEQMNVSDEQMEEMMNMKYRAMGIVSQDPKTGKTMGWWFDNWRGVHTGSGEMVGENKEQMVWEGAMGTRTETTEKVSQDKMVNHFKSSGEMGEYEGKSEMTRVKTPRSPEALDVERSEVKAKKNPD